MPEKNQDKDKTLSPNSGNTKYTINISIEDPEKHIEILKINNTIPGQKNIAWLAQNPNNNNIVYSENYPVYMPNKNPISPNVTIKKED
ncbi:MULTISPECIES: hypothetical protein [Flavobacterium]|uniref:Uncharacterized protein n=1 Tax=Flavobacterium jumunjinense TaxID=998845 RepID=A0ABV5GTZ1_9FLAO|nr:MULTISPECIES: hypothetical protein [Flavobacterium]